MAQFSLPLELIHHVKRGDINEVKGYLQQLIDEKGHDDFPSSPEYVYALRVAISRNDPDMCAAMTNVLCHHDMVDAGTVIAASYKNVRVFMAVVGVDGHCLMNKEFNTNNHPIVTAASVGNFPVVKFIVDWIRDGGGAEFIIKNMKIDQLKQNIITQAAMANSVSICKLVATTDQHNVLAFKTLVSVGHTDAAKRFINDVDFMANNFELMKMCAPFPDLLEEAMKSKSLVKHKYDMPTLYSKLAMESANMHVDEHLESVRRSFKNQLKIEASAHALATGCSTKEAITAAHAKLKRHYC